MTIHHAHKNRLTPDGKMSFAPTPTAPLAELLSRIVDDALVAHSKAEYEATRGSGVGEVAKKRIGSGYIGVECGRELAYRYHRAEKENRPSVVAPGELQRHALVGHWTEASAAEWLYLAGFKILTHRFDQDGNPILDTFGKPKQIGYMAARDPETGQARMAGEVDGVIIATPPAIGGLIKVPCIWESKKATAKKWKKFSADGVAVADPRYYGQLQTNMAYLDITQTLFSMLNVDNMKFYWELVTLDPQHAQMLTDRAVQVMQTETPEEMPRIGKTSTDWRCKFCDFHNRCWTEKAEPETGVMKPSWLGAAN